MFQQQRTPFLNATLGPPLFERIIVFLMKLASFRSTFHKYWPIEEFPVYNAVLMPNLLPLPCCMQNSNHWSRPLFNA